jgi:hypothetical protein
MKRNAVLLGLLALSCTEKVPPSAPPQPQTLISGGGGGGERQEIDEPSPGGPGGPGWPYVWVSFNTVDTNYGAGTSAEALALKSFATDTGKDFVFNYNTDLTSGTGHRVPSLVDKDSQADMITLAKSMYYMVDGSGVPCQMDGYCEYNKAWHGIRSMMRNFYNFNAGTWSPTCSGAAGAARPITPCVMTPKSRWPAT